MNTENTNTENIFMKFILFVLNIRMQPIGANMTSYNNMYLGMFGTAFFVIMSGMYGWSPWLILGVTPCIMILLELGYKFILKKDFNVFNIGFVLFQAVLTFIEMTPFLDFGLVD